PKYRQYLANHLNNLIRVARGHGDTAVAAQAQHELEKLKSTDPAILALDARLTAVLKGKQTPKDDAQRLQLANRAYHKALYAASAGLFAEALQAQPALAVDLRQGHRYNAACASALAGTGRGKDAPPPDDAAKSGLRKQALAWLKADLAAWSKRL